MKLLGLVLCALSFSLPVVATADPWKDESGHGKGRKHDRSEYKEEYWEGNCKVERKWERDGDFKEERKCKAPRYSHRERHYEPAWVYVPAPDHAPAPVYVPAPDYAPAPVYVPAPPHVIVEPGITIHGTVRLPH